MCVWYMFAQRQEEGIVFSSTYFFEVDISLELRLSQLDWKLASMGSSPIFASLSWDYRYVQDV